MLSKATNTEVLRYTNFPHTMGDNDGHLSKLAEILGRPIISVHVLLSFLPILCHSLFFCVSNQVVYFHYSITLRRPGPGMGPH